MLRNRLRRYLKLIVPNDYRIYHLQLICVQIRRAYPNSNRMVAYKELFKVNSTVSNRRLLGLPYRIAVNHAVSFTQRTLTRA